MQSKSKPKITAQHTGLDDSGRDVSEHSIDLFSRELGRNLMDVVDTHGILGRQRRRGRHGVAAMSGDDLLVCFKAPVNMPHQFKYPECWSSINFISSSW